jgi:hypothetical protein
MTIHCQVCHGLGYDCSHYTKLCCNMIHLKTKRDMHCKAEREVKFGILDAPAEDDNEVA